jgi:hypothetical protein
MALISPRIQSILFPISATYNVKREFIEATVSQKPTDLKIMHSCKKTCIYYTNFVYRVESSRKS